MACSGPQKLDTQNVDGANKASAIVGGTTVKSGTVIAQSVVMLINRVTTEICTASLIDNQFAITAAHCVDIAHPGNMYLFFDVQAQGTSPRRQVISVQVSPYWSTSDSRPDNRGDIAIVRYSGGLAKGYTGSLLLNGDALLHNNADVILAGYGVTDNNTRVGAGTLRMTTVKISDSDYSETEVAVDQTQGKGSCHGDSGGPAYIFTGGKYYLWGVTSGGIATDNCNETAAYTKIDIYLPWMQETMQEMKAAN